MVEVPRDPAKLHRNVICIQKRLSGECRVAVGLKTCQIWGGAANDQSPVRMSEFKFACPACAQHITCDSAKTGTTVDCPTCFQKLIVPHAPEADGSKFILTASLASSRRFQTNQTKPHTAVAGYPGKKIFPSLLLGFLGVIIGLVIVFAVREKLLSGSAESRHRNDMAAEDHSIPSTNWTLNLSQITFPESPAAGRINHQHFTVDRVVLRGGLLEMRQGQEMPPELALTIAFFARQGEDLAGQSISIAPDRTNAPRALMVYKNKQGQFIGQPYTKGYALKLEFGQVNNGFLPGKIYFCAPDEAKSWVAGAFDAEIRKPSSSQSRQQRTPGQKR